jgi:hypothetical protein
MGLRNSSNNIPLNFLGAVTCMTFASSFGTSSSQMQTSTSAPTPTGADNLSTNGSLMSSRGVGGTSKKGCDLIASIFFDDYLNDSDLPSNSSLFVLSERACAITVLLNRF